MMKTHVPEAEVHSEVGTELAIRLPMHCSSKFPMILSELDLRRDEFGLETYGLSATTLEEVFLRVAHGEDSVECDRRADTDSVSESGELSGLIDNGGGGTSSASMEHRGVSVEAVRAHARKISEDSFQRHFMALFLKRFHYYKRDAKAACFQLAIPILAVLFGLLLIRAGLPGNFPSYQMSSAKLNIQPNGKVLENRVPYTSFLLDSQGSFIGLQKFNSYLANVPSQNVSLLPYTVDDLRYQTDFFGFHSTYSLAFFPNLEQYEALVNFTTHLLQTRNEFKASKYGAFSPIADLLNVTMHTEHNETLEYLIQQNTSAFHACPIFMNMMNSAIYGKHKLLARNHPLPFTARQKTIISGIGSFFAALLLVLAFAFIPASYAIFIVKEREIAAKHQQLISGVSISAYWVSTFVWDFTSYLLPMFGSIAMIFIFDVQEFISTDSDRLAALFLLFLFYGSSVSGQTYIITYFFKHYSAAQNFVLFINMISMVLVLASFIMGLVKSTCEANKDLQYVFLLFPGYALGNGLIDLSFLSIIRQLNECDEDQSAESNIGDDDDEPFQQQSPVTALQSTAALKNVVYMAVLTVVYFAIAVGIDYFLARPDWVQKFSRKPKPLNDRPLEEHEVDADVRNEAGRCSAQGSSYSSSDDVILLQNLRKVYAGGKVAVRDISFGVPTGEVFGFLGINGAGKTSVLVCYMNHIWTGL